MKNMARSKSLSSHSEASVLHDTQAPVPNGDLHRQDLREAHRSNRVSLRRPWNHINLIKRNMEKTPGQTFRAAARQVQKDSVKDLEKLLKIKGIRRYGILEALELDQRKSTRQSRRADAVSKWRTVRKQNIKSTTIAQSGKAGMGHRPRVIIEKRVSLRYGEKKIRHLYTSSREV